MINITKFNCGDSGFTDNNGIDILYAAFNHQPKERIRTTQIIKDINENQKNNKYPLDIDYRPDLGGWTSRGKRKEIIYWKTLFKKTLKLIQGNTKTYIHDKILQKNDPNWWEKRQKGGLPLGHHVKLRIFWVRWFSLFKRWKNYKKFEEKILNQETISSKYEKALLNIQNKGVSTNIDPELQEIIVKYNVYYELWRLNKPIFCTYRTLLAECHTGIKESFKCVFDGKDGLEQRIKNIDEIKLERSIISSLPHSAAVSNLLKTYELNDLMMKERHRVNTLQNIMMNESSATHESSAISEESKKEYRRAYNLDNLPYSSSLTTSDEEVKTPDNFLHKNQRYLRRNSGGMDVSTLVTNIIAPVRSGDKSIIHFIDQDGNAKGVPSQKTYVKSEWRPDEPRHSH